ncbi:MAG: SCO family protein, partial [Candidatus Eremiobacteraeota bacterium]|nr:SCO family protein [Candidatus Eremiobacteraeota bacterium]
MFPRLVATIAIIAATLSAHARAEMIPVHGTVLAVPRSGEAIVRNDAVTYTMPSIVRRYRVEPALRITPGVGIDGFIDRTTTPWRWYDASIAGKFAPGLPDKGKVDPIDIGTQLPHTTLVDQRGRSVDIARDFAGKATLISFVFTRCPDKDECPTVSSKFAYLQQHLEPSNFHLVLLTLDPPYDSPAVLSRYARQFGADANRWSILTGPPSEVQHLLNRFGISSLRVS